LRCLLLIGSNGGSNGIGRSSTSSSSTCMGVESVGIDGGTMDVRMDIDQEITERGGATTIHAAGTMNKSTKVDDKPNQHRSVNNNNNNNEEENDAKRWTFAISNQLFQLFSDETTTATTATTTTSSIENDEAMTKTNVINTSKQQQNTQAVKLLKHMTKGTQQQSMFADPSALKGYTRQKFNERAMLFYTSMERLRWPDPSSNRPTTITSDNDGEEEYCLTSDQERIREKVFAMIQGGKIRNICSIGCGPGNDALGVLTFLRMVYGNTQCTTTTVTDATTPPLIQSTISSSLSSSPILERVILLDWAIDEWSDTILQPFRKIVQDHKLVRTIEVGFCDVTKKLNDSSNDDARLLMLGSDGDDERSQTRYSGGRSSSSSSSREEKKEGSGIDEGDQVKRQDPLPTLHSKRMSTTTDTDISESTTNQITTTTTNTKYNCDLFVISYLVSETRGQWEGFFTDLIHAVDSGTMFYFAEPVPWQLHRLCDLFQELLEFLWIDSSMYYPSLQCLDRRVGPAILFACKK